MRLARMCCAIALALAVLSWQGAARAAPPMSELVRAELIAEPAAITPGEPFWVGLRLRIKERWHVYWRNPGDSGEAVAITWTLPPGFAADPIVWPTPQPHPHRPPRQFRLRARDDAAHPHHAARRHRCRRAGRPQGRTSPGWCARRSAFRARRACRSTLPVAGPARRPASIRAHARSSMRRGHPCRSPRPGRARMEVAPEWLTLNVRRQGPEGRDDPLGLSSFPMPRRWCSMRRRSSCR